jgi:hypothetical protein
LEKSNNICKQKNYDVAKVSVEVVMEVEELEMKEQIV